MNALKLAINPYSHLERWTMPDSYFGATWDEYYYSGCGRSRDSDILSNTNFEVMLERLGGESETVVLNRCGHWAVGWVESIMIHESDVKALTIANDIMRALEDYPVIDDSAYSEAEYESYREYAEQEQEDLADFLIEVFSIPVEFRSDVVELAYRMNMDAQSYGGEDSAVNYNIYAFQCDVDREANGTLDVDAKPFSDNARRFTDRDLSELLEDVNRILDNGSLTVNQCSIVEFINVIGNKGTLC